MRMVCKVSTAFYGFERSASAVMVSGQAKARISKGLVFRKAKAPLTNFRLAGQFNRTLSNSGFFAPIDAVLQTIPVRESRRLGVLGERKHSSASRGRSTISQYVQDVGVKGLNHAATVLHVRDVAGAYSPEPTIKLNAGTANRTVSRIGFNPTPA